MCLYSGLFAVFNVYNKMVARLQDIQWNPSKADNLVPRNLSIIAGCPCRLGPKFTIKHS